MIAGIGRRIGCSAGSITLRRRGGGSLPSLLPEQIPSLTLDFYAPTLSGSDGSTITEWVDQASAVAAASSGTPTLRTTFQKGKSVVELDGSSQFDFTAFSGAELTIFAVVRPRQSLAIRTLTAKNDLSSFIGFDPSRNDAWSAAAGGGSSFDRYANGGVGSWSVVIWSRNGTTRSFYLNGNLLTRTDDDLSASAFEFGNIGGQSDYKFTGHVGRIGVCSTALSAEDAILLSRGLANQWLNGKIVIPDGNSLTAGYGATVSYPEVLQQLLGPTWDVSQGLGVPGIATPDLDAIAPGRVDSVFSTLRQRHILVAWEMVNDLADGATGPEAIQNFKDYITARKAAAVAAGIMLKIIVPTLTPSSGQTTDWQTGRTACNVFLRDTANIGVWWDAVADVDADPRLSTLTETYYSDFIHMTNAGYAVVAEVVAATINATAS